MATWTGYYDASGSETEPGARALVVVGLYATVEKWLEFDRYWQNALTLDNAPWFRMVDFAAGKHHFREWYSDKQRRAAFISHLQTALLECAKIESLGVYLEAYRQVNAEYCLAEGIGGPYGVCAWAAIQGIEEKIRESDAVAQVKHFVELGDIGQREFRKAIEQRFECPHDIVFLPKVDEAGKRIAPFEGADMVAWEHRRFHEDFGDALAGGPVSEKAARKSLLGLHQGWDKVWLQYFREKHLRSWCEKNPGIFPRRAD